MPPGGGDKNGTHGPPYCWGRVRGVCGLLCFGPPDLERAGRRPGSATPWAFLAHRRHRRRPWEPCRLEVGHRPTISRAIRFASANVAASPQFRHSSTRRTRNRPRTGSQSRSACRDRRRPPASIRLRLRAAGISWPILPLQETWRRLDDVWSADRRRHCALRTEAGAAGTADRATRRGAGATRLKSHQNKCAMKACRVGALVGAAGRRPNRRRHAVWPARHYLLTSHRCRAR